MRRWQPRKCGSNPVLQAQFFRQRRAGISRCICHRINGRIGPCPDFSYTQFSYRQIGIAPHYEVRGDPDLNRACVNPALPPPIEILPVGPAAPRARSSHWRAASSGETGPQAARLAARLTQQADDQGLSHASKSSYRSLHISTRHLAARPNAKQGRAFRDQ